MSLFWCSFTFAEDIYFHYKVYEYNKEQQEQDKEKLLLHIFAEKDKLLAHFYENYEQFKSSNTFRPVEMSIVYNCLINLCFLLGIYGIAIWLIIWTIMRKFR